MNEDQRNLLKILRSIYYALDDLNIKIDSIVGAVSDEHTSCAYLNYQTNYIPVIRDEINELESRYQCQLFRFR
jgi:hypothetical protein